MLWSFQHYRLGAEEQARPIHPRWAAARDGRTVTIGPLALFSIAGGDAWLLDPAHHLATRIAQDGDPLPIHIEQTKPCVAQRVDLGRSTR